MIAHIAEFEGPADVLEGIGMQGFRDRVVPVLEAQPGFEGYLILLNREKGKLLGVTLWDTEETVYSPAPGWNRNVGQESMKWERTRRSPKSTTSSRSCRALLDRTALRHHPASRAP